MELSNSTGRVGQNGRALVADAEDVLRQEEDALARLEALLVKERWCLFNSSPQGLLDVIEEVEDAKARVEHSENARGHLAANVAAMADDAASSAPSAAGSRLTSSASAAFLASRYRVLGTIARIAERNAANAMLVAGLSRTVAATLARLDRQREATPNPLTARMMKDTMVLWRPAGLDAQV